MGHLFAHVLEPPLQGWMGAKEGGAAVFQVVEQAENVAAGLVDAVYRCISAYCRISSRTGSMPAHPVAVL